MQGDAAPGKESQDGVMECVIVWVWVWVAGQVTVAAAAEPTEAENTVAWVPKAGRPAGLKLPRRPKTAVEGSQLLLRWTSEIPARPSMFAFCLPTCVQDKPAINASPAP